MPVRGRNMTRERSRVGRRAGLCLVGVMLLASAPSAAQDVPVTASGTGIESAYALSGRAFALFDRVSGRILQTGATPSMRDTLREALAVWRRAAALYQQADSTARVSTMLNNMGNVHLLLGAPDSAQVYLEQAKRLARHAHDDENEGKALTALGTVYSQQGRIGLTMAYLDSALVAYRRLGDPALEAGVLLNLGILETMRGQTEAALAHFEQTLALEEKAPDKSIKARALHGIGDAYYNLDRLDEARPFYQEAMALYTETGALLALTSLIGTMTAMALEETSRLLARAVETEDCTDRYNALDAVEAILEASASDMDRMIERMTYLARNESDLKNAEALVASITQNHQAQQEMMAAKTNDLRERVDALCQR